MHFAGWAVVNDRIADAVVITAKVKGDTETVIGVFRSGVRSNVTAGPTGRRFMDAGWGGDIPKQRLIYDTAKRNCGMNAYVMDTQTNEFFELEWSDTAVVSWCHD